MQHNPKLDLLKNGFIEHKLAELAKRFNGYRYLTIQAESKFLDFGTPNRSLIIGVIKAHKCWPTLKISEAKNNDESSSTTESELITNYTSKENKVCEVIPLPSTNANTFLIYSRVKRQFVDAADE